MPVVRTGELPYYIPITQQIHSRDQVGHDTRYDNPVTDRHTKRFSLRPKPVVARESFETCRKNPTDFLRSLDLADDC